MEDEMAPRIRIETLDRMRLCFRIKGRFSWRLTQLYYVIHRQMSLLFEWLTSGDEAFKFLHFFKFLKLLALSAFVLSYAVHFWVYLSQVERTGTIRQFRTSPFALPCAPLALSNNFVKSSFYFCDRKMDNVMVCVEEAHACKPGI